MADRQTQGKILEWEGNGIKSDIGNDFMPSLVREIFSGFIFGQY
ncbi:hypothetical protein PY092_08060 [Muricauda sp. 334s03]|uniref:Uncharacterized protein n=1 Tax=Flagellimonas yonaguniensis TaxID=3031325 RepID=A0ABT5XY74_9FLAO|nr:hypothetical protein [[Muricauda] yonaguniensis]MDF0716095.1 hypothetical protein [[Muricauda] yonaguniensis]